MQFGSAVGEARFSFILTNIDDTFVLVTYKLTPIEIVVGQYIGFTVITGVSLIGYAAAVGLPSEPIGFLGLLPLLLGVWKGLGVAAIAIYVVTYYILLGVLCLITFLTMKQKHIVHIAEKYASFIIPFLCIGLGIYITLIQLLGNPGKIVINVVTSFILFFIMAGMVWIRMRKRNSRFNLRRTAPRNAVSSAAENSKDIYLSLRMSVREQQLRSREIQIRRS
ncbi:hypothetical protein COCSADRAFT_356658 [Bipolaris sorokiniana ND90Pr]|uniref:Uncharacterized protein n=1 Tax=Cochliobolus sativus (strain ND90Pr / ATCC 201652) TaxID=665912 RepID=M2REQ3_COCSN|nr:uncharacterized protein COCSADRAFT_356658 [Bipolaris sorokiniana ND90Pr]EMD65254.1 hypothetical protein COCSADRAFT_356658 [Bipolaris sorokiniana ND90Pr]